MRVKSESHIFHELKVVLSLVLLKFFDGLWERVVVGTGVLALLFPCLISLGCSFENVL